MNIIKEYHQKYLKEYKWASTASIDCPMISGKERLYQKDSTQVKDVHERKSTFDIYAGLSWCKTRRLVPLEDLEAYISKTA